MLAPKLTASSRVEPAHKRGHSWGGASGGSAGVDMRGGARGGCVGQHCSCVCIAQVHVASAGALSRGRAWNGASKSGRPSSLPRG